MDYSSIQLSAILNSCEAIKSELSKYECMRLYSEGFIFRLKIKLVVWGIFEFLWCFAVFIGYPWYKFAPILLKFKPLPSKNYRYTCKVKLNYALDATHTSCSKCNMKLKQKTGEEKLLILKQKTLSFNTTIFFYMKIFFIENSLIFLFLGKPGS